MSSISDLTEERAEQIKLALTKIMPHEAVIYHTGMLVSDREAAPGVKSQVDLIGRMAWQLMEDGVIALSQRRRAELEYDYIATGREQAIKRVKTL